MSDLKNLVVEQSVNPNLKYMNISRRTFLKGALAVGGALALAGCNTTTTDPTTAPATTTPATTTPATTTPPTVNATPPTGVTYPSNMPIEKMSYILPDYVKCVGCKKCMVACSYEHYNEPDLYKSNIRVDLAYIDSGRADLPILCMKCGSYTAAVAAVAAKPAEGSTPAVAAVDAKPEVYGTSWGEDNIPCHASCPPSVNAITKDPVTGAMLVDNQKCTACGNCVTACADKGAGILRLSKDRMSLLGMCDLCKGEPKCVLACPESCLKVYTTAGNINNSTYIVKPEELAKRVIHMIFGVEAK